MDEFHAANRARAERFPRHLLATQTHDTKRSGDVRARIVALTWLAEAWLGWRRARQTLPDPVEDELLWQTLVGAWPVERERIEAYMVKALREARRNTNWLEPNESHEREVCASIARVYEEDDVAPFVERVAEVGRRISLAMTLLKLTAPGVPDIYQGDELASLNLVDPDNRRPVDWHERRRRLAHGGSPKLELIRRTLALRARRPEAFARGYDAVDAGEGVCAFVRGGEVLVAVPVRRDASLPDFGAGWTDALGADLGVALLERQF